MVNLAYFWDNKTIKKLDSLTVGRAHAHIVDKMADVVTASARKTKTAFLSIIFELLQEG